MTLAVITPAFQAEATLDAALASVAAQTQLPNEVVIADDGSTDGTLAVARAWETRLPLRVIATGANLGPSGARAAAINASSSDLLALLDADDVFLTDHLELMTAAYAKTNDGLASADTLRWIAGLAISETPLSAMAPVPPPAQQLDWLLVANHLSIASLFSRAGYESVGGFRSEFRGTEDWDLWIRMVRNGATVVRPSQPTLLYRLSEGNVSSEDRLVAAKLQVLDAAAREGSAAEQRAIAIGRRRLRAAASLNDAYAKASGRGARLAGLRALRGIRPVAMRGAAMALAPRYAARRRAEVRFDPDVWMRRYGA